MEQPTTPPNAAIAEVAQWLVSTHDAAENPTTRFYAKLVLDLLTRTGGLLPGFDPTDHPMHVQTEGDYTVLFRWLLDNGSYQLEGVVANRTDGQAFLTSDLRHLPWRPLLDDAVRSRLADAERVAEFGSVIRDYATPEARQVWDDQRHDEISESHTAALNTSSRRRYDDAHYVDVARLYDEAVAAGSRAPNRYIADRMGVKSTSTVKNWVVECRRRGLLPPTEERKAKGNR